MKHANDSHIWQITWSEQDEVNTERQVVCSDCNSDYARIAGAFCDSLHYLGWANETNTPKGMIDKHCPECGADDGWKSVLPNGDRFCVYCKDVTIPGNVFEMEKQ